MSEPASPSSEPGPSREADSAHGIPPGTIDLLEQICATGSIAAACRAMAIPLKRAWDLIDQVHQLCGQAAVIRQTDHRTDGDGSLTAFGLGLIKRSRGIETAASAAARKRLLASKRDTAAKRRF